MKYPAILFLLLIALIPAVSAFSFQNLTINPQGSTIPGEPVTVLFTLKPNVWQGATTSTGAITTYTANPFHKIIISSELQYPHWEENLTLFGVSNIQSNDGPSMVIDGHDIAYQWETNLPGMEFVNITLTGYAPDVQSTRQSNFLIAAEYDSNGIMVPGSMIQIQEVVTNASDLAAGIYNQQQNLITFNSHITQANIAGIDTTGAETIYQSASANLGIAQNMPPAQYPQAITLLNDVSADITSGENMLDKQWAERDISHAVSAMEKLYQVTGWFTGNKSTANYPGLANLTKMRNDAGEHINSASNYENAGDYSSARSEAKEAYDMITADMPAALALQKKAMDPLSIVWDNEWAIFATLFGLFLIWTFKPVKK